MSNLTWREIAAIIALVISLLSGGKAYLPIEDKKDAEVLRHNEHQDNRIERLQDRLNEIFVEQERRRRLVLEDIPKLLARMSMLERRVDLLKRSMNGGGVDYP